MSPEEEKGDTSPTEFRAYPKSVQPGIPKLGPVPEGWVVLPLRRLLKPVQRPVSTDDAETYQLVTAKRNRGGIVAREQLLGRDIATKTQFWTHAGDFLISRRQIAHGACGVVPSELDRSLVSNEYAALLPTDAMNRNFMRHWPHSIYFQQTCFHSSIGVHVEKLVFNLDDWLDWPFAIASEPEQRRIAALLDEWDEAIAIAEQLANQLLRSRVGLEATILGDGDEIALTEMAEVKFSGVDKRIVEAERSVRLCNYMDVLRNRRITDRVQFSEGTATEAEFARFSLRRDDVIFTKDSETTEEIAEAAYVADDLTNVICGYHLAVARPKPGYSGAYISHAMRVPLLRQQFVVRAHGAVRCGLTLDAMHEVRLPAPSFERQLAIAAALDAADDEADSYRTLAAHLRRQKRGLMQKLLTGELRVPESIDRLLPGGADADRIAEAAA